MLSICYNSRVKSKTNKKTLLKSVCVRSYSGRYFSAFRLNTERYGVYLENIQTIFSPNAEKMRTRITRNTDTFYTVTIS